MARAFYYLGDACQAAGDKDCSHRRLPAGGDADARLADRANQTRTNAAAHDRRRRGGRGFRKVVALTPNDADAHNNLGLVLMQRGEGDAAVKEFQEAVKLRPDDAGFRGNLGISQMQLANFDAAIEELRKAIAMSPNDASLHYDLGLALKLKDNLPGGIAEMKKAIAAGSEIGGRVLHAGQHHVASRENFPPQSSICEKRLN